MVAGPAETPFLQYNGMPASPVTSWPYLYRLPPERMVYRFAPYTGEPTPADNSTPGDATTFVSGQNNSPVQFAVTPNPARDVITIAHEGVKDGIVTLSDITGKTIWQKELAAIDKVNISGLAPGMYFIRIVSPGVKVFTTGFSKR